MGSDRRSPSTPPVCVRFSANYDPRSNTNPPEHRPDHRPRGARVCPSTTAQCRPPTAPPPSSPSPASDRPTDQCSIFGRVRPAIEHKPRGLRPWSPGTKGARHRPQDPPHSRRPPTPRTGLQLPGPPTTRHRGQGFSVPVQPRACSTVAILDAVSQGLSTTSLQQNLRVANPAAR